ncbi:autophagy-related protein 13 isoform 2-T2 [Rhinophrynus dorsalis]
MDTDLSPQDRKDLDKFVKFFALKAVQVIVQARLGDKICTRSSSSPTGSDWFNLAIKDIPEVTHEAKKALSGQLPAVGRSMCVEISLKTSEGDSMELEIWCLEMNEKCDRDIKVSYTVYNRLSLLLKSLLAVTRVTPAYRLSRKQGHEYVILYRIYFGDVQLLGLKEGFQAVRVGTVGTPIGTLTLTCAYRTNLAFMSTRQYERTQPIMGIIIDHFVDRPFPSTSHMHPCNYRASEEQGVTYPAVEESQEVCATSFSTSPPSQCVFTLSKAQCQTVAPVVTDSLKVLPMGLAFSHQLCSSRLSYQPAVLGAGTSELGYPAALAAGVSATHPHQVVCPETPEEVSPETRSLQSSCSSNGTPQDDYVMVDFKPAFSKEDLPMMDVGTFYREFQNPPQLSSLSIDIAVQSMAEDLDSLPEKLAMHEENMKEFDAFVDSL